MLRLPIARLGKWHHDSYGTVEFTQQDFNDIKDNFQKNVRGYEPYLRYGHNQKGSGLHGAEPAQGFLKKLEQKGDVLWGDFDTTNNEVEDEVKTGKYRYGSAELVRNGMDKGTGQRLSIFLKGHTLTNEPFVPNLPRNQVVDTQYLSEDGANSQFFTLNLSDQEALSDPDNNELVTPSMDPNTGMLHSLMQSVMNLFQRVQELPTKEDIMNIVNQAEAKEAEEECYDDKPKEMACDDGTYPVTQLGSTVKVGDEYGRPTTTDMLDTSSKERLSPSEMSLADPEVTSEEPTVEMTEQENEEVTPEVIEPAVDEPQVEEVAEPEAAPAADVEGQMNMTNNQPSDVERQLNELKARLDALSTERDQALLLADKAKTELEERALSDRMQAEKTARELALQKEQRFAQMLTDRVNNLVGQGVPPVLAERAKKLATLLRANVGEEQTFVLSEDAKPVDIIDGVFSLLSEVTGVVDFTQHGYQLSEVDMNANQDENPWANRITSLRTKHK